MSSAVSRKTVIFLDGPIGVGKTTLGRSLAAVFSAGFVEGDDHAMPGKPWYASSLSTGRRIVDASMTALKHHELVFVSYPLRCVNWIFYTNHFQSADIRMLVAGLQASPESLTNGQRSRKLSAAEIDRSLEMMQQGYGKRDFSSFFTQTDAGSLEDVTTMVATQVRDVLATDRG